MIKIRVYSRYMTISFIIISVLCLTFIAFSCVLIPSNFICEKIILTIFLGLAALLILWYAGYLTQYLLIGNDKIILKNIYKSMVIIQIDEISRIVIQTLPTYFSWASTIYKKYICIYSEINNIDFSKGSSNKTGLKRIQMIYDEDKFNKLKQIIQFDIK